MNVAEPVGISLRQWPEADGANTFVGSVTVDSGTLQTAIGLTQTFGALSVSGSTSLIDFMGNAATLNFATLSLGGHLSIWNYSGAASSPKSPGCHFYRCAPLGRRLPKCWWPI